MSIKHNLPSQPYEKFFGRAESIKTIEENLLTGGIFIASIDGVGGMGKTALAYHFCQEKLVKDNNGRFEYLVWISSKSEHNNCILLERIGKIPLGIEFVIRQRASGRSLGAIYREFDGYPKLSEDMNEEAKRETMSAIIRFSFKNMYETLDEIHQNIFVTVAILQNNRHKNDHDISLDLLMNITSVGKDEIERVLEHLIENNLLDRGIGNIYQISQMAVNFAKQNFEIYEAIEDDVVGKFRNLVRPTHDPNPTGAELFLRQAQIYSDQNNYTEAKQSLENGLARHPRDYRLYYELGKIQRSLNEWAHAADSFKQATDSNPTNARVWFDWVHMEDNRGRLHIALQKADDALRRTNCDVSILIQKLNILKFKYLRSKDRMDLNILRHEAMERKQFYEKEERSSDVLYLLRGWENIERNLLSDLKARDFNQYITVVKELEKNEDVGDTLINTLRRAANTLRNNGFTGDEPDEFEIASKSYKR